jgi:hypothetical protein
MQAHLQSSPEKSSIHGQSFYLVQSSLSVLSCVFMKALLNEEYPRLSLTFDEIGTSADDSRNELSSFSTAEVVDLNAIETFSRTWYTM